METQAQKDMDQEEEVKPSLSSWISLLTLCRSASNLSSLVSFQNGLNALHLAAKEGHVDLVQELLDRGAPVDSATKVRDSVSSRWDKRLTLQLFDMSAQSKPLPVCKPLIEDLKNSEFISLSAQ